MGRLLATESEAKRLDYAPSVIAAVLILTPISIFSPAPPRKQKRGVSAAEDGLPQQGQNTVAVSPLPIKE